MGCLRQNGIMPKILILNGPNLDRLGIREPEIYGHQTLNDIIGALKDHAKRLGHEIEALQSNAEHKIIEAIHKAADQKINFILINPGALTHTSIALRDAFLAVKIPFIELHLSNIHSRESFRHVSYLSDIAVGVVMGFGDYSYSLALLAADHYLKDL